MLPHERRLVKQLFDRLANFESSTRDPDAEQLIAAGLRRAPHAVYALVQTVLVQDRALRQANALIEDLQSRVTERGQRAAPRSFLGDTGEAEAEQRDLAVPTPARSPASPAYPAQAPQPPAPPQDGPPPGSGGSFLGNAASAAAGAFGGALLLDGIRSMLGRPASPSSPRGRDTNSAHDPDVDEQRRDAAAEASIEDAPDLLDMPDHAFNDDSEFNDDKDASDFAADDDEADYA